MDLNHKKINFMLNICKQLLISNEKNNLHRELQKQVPQEVRPVVYLDEVN